MKNKMFLTIVVIVVAVVLLLGGAFYWYEWRPSQIRVACSQVVKEREKGAISLANDIIFNECLHDNGL